MCISWCPEMDRCAIQVEFWTQCWLQNPLWIHCSCGSGFLMDTLVSCHSSKLNLNLCTSVSKLYIGHVIILLVLYDNLNRIVRLSQIRLVTSPYRKYLLAFFFSASPLWFCTKMATVGNARYCTFNTKYTILGF